MKRVEHCRLETHPGFFDFFVDGCQFKPVGIARARVSGMIELIDTSPARRRAAGRVHAAARLSARLGARGTGRGAGRLGARLVRRSTDAVGLRARSRRAPDRRRRDRQSTACRSPAPSCATRSHDAGAAQRDPRRRQRRAGARRRGAGALARRKAGRVLLPRGLRLGGRRAPGHDDRRAIVRVGRRRDGAPCCRTTAPDIPSGTSTSSRRCSS